ncbi:hypothetical protein ETB97_005207 [Aspergillus alliaceus]|uniref:Clr5 domain-containing protein n=1 Tax=Petromyces alliaceus TaxID=209559 RepID=A0A8H6A1U6_PETAA|nr:hypothetical protein ETB97_005207 [Aspergillus burnettii]
MKHQITSELWEKNKRVIVKLYRDEEWPLKQVIKRISSNDFNPSETQLRSRLKKWRITKPSRQIWKRPHARQQEAVKIDSNCDVSPPRGRSPFASLTTQQSIIQQLCTVDFTTKKSEWYTTDELYTRQEDLPNTVPLGGDTPSNAWAPMADQRRSISPSNKRCDISTDSPSVLVTTSSYDMRCATSTGGRCLDPHNVAYIHPWPPYTVATDSSMQTFMPAIAPIHWSIPEGCSGVPENVTQHPPLSFFHSKDSGTPLYLEMYELQR